MAAGGRLQGSLTTFTASEAQCANSAAWLSPSNAVRASQRSAGASGSCLTHCACRVSIALGRCRLRQPRRLSAEAGLLRRDLQAGIRGEAVEGAEAERMEDRLECDMRIVRHG